MATPLRSYAQRNARLNALIDSQRASGADLVYALPSVVVVGSQSVGKSSLIEAFSRVNLPRAQSTCTRVPMQVSLQQGAEDSRWTGSVRIRPAARGSTEIHFADLRDPSQVTGMLLRAQLAALAMAEDSAPSSQEDIDALLSWRGLSDEELLEETKDRSKNFSSNLVVLNIRSADTPSLTVIDLPGLIQTGDKDAELVRQLAQTYIAGNALILCTLSTTHDIDNQEAWTLCRAVDPNGERTIGVLTRVDVCPRNEELKWIDMLKGASLEHHLRLGFYACRQVTSQELESGGLSYREARDREDKFFSSHPVWGRLDANTKRCLGTSNLVSALSDKLAEFIANQLPKMLDNATTALRQTQDHLSKLPEPTHDDPTTQALSILRSIRQACDLTVSSGRGGSDRLISDLRLKASDFAEDLRATRPVFDVRLQRKSALQPTAPAFAASSLFGLPTATTVPGFNFLPPPMPTASPEPPSGPRPRRPSLVPEPIKLDDVRKRIENNIGRTLPGSVPETVKLEMMQESVAQWPNLAREYAHSVKPDVEKALMAIVDEYTNGFAGLRQLMRQCVLDASDQQAKKTLAHLRELIRAQDLPFTLNDHYFQDTLVKYKSRYIKERVGGVINSTEQAHRELGAALKQAGFEGVSIDELYLLDKRFSEDRTPLDLCAYTVAFWKVSRKVFADQIPQAVDRLYVRDLPAVLDQTISAALYRSDEGQTAQQRLSTLMHEDSAVNQRRKDLTQRSVALRGLITALEDFKRRESAPQRDVASPPPTQPRGLTSPPINGTSSFRSNGSTYGNGR